MLGDDIARMLDLPFPDTPRRSMNLELAAATSAAAPAG